jgi:hypothetical protein
MEIPGKIFGEIVFGKNLAESIITKLKFSRMEFCGRDRSQPLMYGGWGVLIIRV